MKCEHIMVKTQSQQLKQFMKENFARFNSNIKCPVCKGSWTGKTKYKKSCCTCGTTIKYSPEHNGFKFLDNYERLSNK